MPRRDQPTAVPGQPPPRYSRLRRALSAVCGGLRRHPVLASAVAASVLGLSALAWWALPRSWHVETVLLTQRTPTLPALTNPNRAVPRDADAPTRAAADLVLGHESLATLMGDADLVARAPRHEGPIGRAAEWVLRRVGAREPSEEDRRTAVEEQLRKRLYLVVGNETVAIGVAWPDAAEATAIVRLAARNFLDARRAQELMPIVQAIALLDRHVAEARSRVDAAMEQVAEVEQRLGREPPPAPRARPSSPAPPRPPPPDPVAERLQQALSAHQAELDSVIAGRRRRLADLEGRLSELRTVYSDQHPIVDAVRSSIASLDREPPEALTLRQEIASLQRACAERRGCSGVLVAPRALAAPVEPEDAYEDDDAARATLAPPTRASRPLGPRARADAGRSWRRALGLEPPAETELDRDERRDELPEGDVGRPPRAAARAVDGGRPSEHPDAIYARDVLRAAVRDHEQLAGRADAARIELDVARTAFAYRYAELRAPELPRRPSSPRQPALAIGGALCALALAAFATLAVDWPLPASPRRRRWLVGLVTASVATSTLAILALVDEPLVALGPAVAVTLVWATCVLPLRHSVLTLTFLMLALEARGDAGNKWRAPWATVGYLLNTNLNLVFPVESLRFTGADVVIAGLLVLLAWRRITGSRLDSDGAVPTARPMLQAVLASLATIGLLIAYGLAHGGVFAQVLWQCHQVLLIMVTFALYQAALRGPRDLPALAKTVLAAALVKAAQAFYVRHSLGLDKEALPTATSHHDSMLFAIAACMVVALCCERRIRRSFEVALLALPVLALGIQANNRRLAWIEVVVCLVVVYLMNPPSRLKRALQRAALLATPLLAIYIGVGWHGTSRIFGPVAKIRSIVDSNDDRSAQERDVENYNLIRNLADHPVVGVGFGHEYVEYVPNDDISHIFPQWKFIPHNSILGLLAFCGLAGFTLLMAPMSVTAFLAARTYRRSRDPVARAAAITSIGAVFVYLIQCYGDMGLVAWHSVFLVAPALAVSAKIGTASGAWPVVRRAREAPPARAAPSAAALEAHP